MPGTRVGLGSGTGHLLLNLLAEPLPEKNRYLLGKVVLQRKDLLVRPLDGRAAKLRARLTVDQGDCKPESVTRLGNNTLYQRSHLQSPGNAVWSNVGVAVRPNAILGDHLKRGHPAQLVDELFSQALSQIGQ